MPADLGRYYAADYIELLHDRAERALAAKADRYKLDLVLRVAGRGRLLEIGPGGGAFLELAKDAGFDIEVIEQDQACCRFVEDVLGARTYCSADPASVIRRAGPWDVITLWHSLEHLSDPGDVLAAAAGALAPGAA